MVLDADNVRVALTGAAYSSPSDTTMPTSPDESFAAGWIDHGWISDSGVEEAYSDTTKEIVGWQNGQTVRKIITASEATFKFAMIETKGANLELYHKNSQVADLGGGVAELRVRPPGADRKQFAFDVIDGDEHIRILIHDGEVTDRSSPITYKSDEAIAYEVTITAYPVQLEDDDDGVLTVATKLSSDAAWFEEIGS